MKIQYNDTLIEFVPENDQETKDLGQLWDLLVDCAQFNKKLEPTGEYVPNNPDKNKLARFTIVEK